MGLSVITAAARGGKTEWAVTQALALSAGLAHTPYILLPSKTQVDDFKQRLADRGGAMGVYQGTFRELAQSILDKTDLNLIAISESAQLKLIASLLKKLDLNYYHRIQNKPGFTQAVLAIIRELESGKIEPVAFLEAVRNFDHNGRLEELALVYKEYRDELLKKSWMDPTIQVWMAAEALVDSPNICPNWDSLIIDGFDDLSPVQMDLIVILAKLLPDVTMTITGRELESGRPLVHKRFDRLRKGLEAKHPAVNINLNEEDKKVNSDLFDKLEEFLFSNDFKAPIEPGDQIEMVAVPDREYEVRSALRWIKKQISEGLVEPGETAVTMRNLEPYRKIINKVAQEYSLPILIKGGLPLGENPAVAEILSLLTLSKSGKDGLVWRELISAWQSPYFDWSILFTGSGGDNSRQAHLRETNQISTIASWGNIIQGYEQWKEAFERLINMPSGIERKSSRSSVPNRIPTGNSAKLLWEKFNIFVERITPPENGQAVEVYLHWIEDLLGDLNIEEDRVRGLNIYQRIIKGEPDLIARDHQALRKLTEIFRELIWSSLMFNLGPTTYNEVLVELETEIKRQSYQPVSADENMIICADCTEVRGLYFKSVALMGLAEGEFPGTIKEDPFLRDEDRLVCREVYGLPLRSSTESTEAEFFYEAVTRASERMFITRPRMADNGTPWQPSPFWEELLRTINITPVMKTSRTVPKLGDAASQSEIFEVIAAVNDKQQEKLLRKAKNKYPDYFNRLSLAKRIMNTRSRRSGGADLVYDGNLEHKSVDLQVRFPEEYVWSPSRLESYQTCPLNFFVSNLLGLEMPEPPQEGLDSRQLGNIYHHIMEDIYLSVGEEYDVQVLLSRLPDIAIKIFKEAPEREGFRETTWWRHTQKEILTNIQHSLIVLEGMDTSFRFYRAEQKFGIRNDSAPQLNIKVEGKGSYHLRGLIDRVDINDQGKLRIIDYKTSGSFGFDNQAVKEGKKLQLPLYALAAQQGLQLGDVQEGFYFHVRSAKPSSFKMSSFWNSGARGPESAMENAAIKGWQAVKSIQKGIFSPITPKNGCPEYCPAVEFCWHYRRQAW